MFKCDFQIKETQSNFKTSKSNLSSLFINYSIGNLYFIINSYELKIYFYDSHRAN